jgi:hypothetical protein
MVTDNLHAYLHNKINFHFVNSNAIAFAFLTGHHASIGGARNDDCVTRYEDDDTGERSIGKIWHRLAWVLARRQKLLGLLTLVSLGPIIFLVYRSLEEALFVKDRVPSLTSSACSPRAQRSPTQ